MGADKLAVEETVITGLEAITVPVTKRLPKCQLHGIVSDFENRKLTFAVSRHKSEYELWREVLPGDRPRMKNRKEGMAFAGVIAQDNTELDERNFVCIWQEGERIFGEF